MFLLAKIGNFTPNELKEYEKSLNSMSDYYNIIDSAVARAEKAALERGREEGREKGREEGLVKGREEGREEARLESARKLKQMGVAAEIIAEATGLSPEEIARL